MQVVDHRKWRRAKIKVLVVCFAGALYCAGGLEGSGTDRMPSGAGYVGLMAVCFWLLWNVTRPLPQDSEWRTLARRMRRLEHEQQDQHSSR